MQKANIFITNSDYSANNNTFNYLFGFQPSLAGMFLSEKNLYLILDGRYFEKTKNINKEKVKRIIGNKNLKINYINSKNIISELISIINKEKNLEEIIFEGNIDIKSYEEIKERISIKTSINKEGFFTEKRMIKTVEEKQNIKNAIEIIDKVFEYIQDLNNSGKLIGETELEVRGQIISKIFEFGGEGESFDSIVAFGKNSAIPHHESGNTIIGNGVLLIDMGAKYNSYCSDFTRTFWVGEKNKGYKKFKEIYEIVKQAHNNAFLNTKLGMIGKKIDAFTRDYITKKGYQEQYIHGTGHSLGLDIHEPIWINSKSEEKVQNNMVFTIEPGIYLPGEFGIRLEDIVFMEDGILKKYSKIEI